ncbi:MAG TPA: portal protein [Burkholderiaceae bacterium]|nr:portal protein [Burkholderiaceae bacterium]
MAEQRTLGADELKRRDRVHQRWGALKTERSSWDAHWKEISEYLLPRAGRFFVQDRNKGTRHRSIYDSTGTKALDVLAAGMMAGMTSPARPWFRLTTGDAELDESAAVKTWLADVQRVMLMVFAKSNTYRGLHSIYEELGAFGTAASVVMPDFSDVIRHYPLTCGEYAVATDHRGVVSTLYREFDMTVEQLVGQFGLDRVSIHARNLYDRGTRDAWITVIHAIEPRLERDSTMRDARNMPFRSCYLELGGDKVTFLSEGGFKRFPAVAPRWTVRGGDIYGEAPSMRALGDIKQLQHQQLRKAQAIDYMTKPPLQMPMSMANRERDTLPGGVTFVDMANPSGGIKTAFDVRLDLSHLLADIGDVRGRINSAFHADLFLMLASQPIQGRMTATEVAERHEEKLLMLGPVLERLHNELLSPLIDMTFERVVEAGIVPPAPEELQGMELNVEFVSMLAQAQRAVATNGIDRLLGTVGAIAQMKPDVLDKIDQDRVVDAYADMLGVDPELIVPGERVALIRQARAEQAMQQQQIAEQQAAAATAKDLASAKTDQPSALTNVIDMFSGYTTP